MLKHEDIFSHQVKELHRLYNVQKHLMGALRNDTKPNYEFGPKAKAALNVNNDDLGIISGFDLSRLAEEDISYGGDSSGVHDDQARPNDVELTLSIGPSTSLRQSQNHHYQAGGNDSKGVIRTNSGNSSTLFNQDSKRPHWLFKDLSLHRT
ncbi:hypothetical protein Tco_0971772 [Tanacetum coccineum]